MTYSKFLIFIFICFAFVGVSAQTAVVPIPVKNTPIDSAAILQAKYDSLVRHMMKAYALDSFFNEEPAIPHQQVENEKTDAAVKADIPLQKEEAITPPVLDSTRPTIPEQPTSSSDSLGAVPATVPLTFNELFLDTPRIKPVTPIDADTMLLDDFDTEELLVDTSGLESMGDLADDGDEAESEGEAEGEFDNQFTGYSDVSYWDLLRDPNFKFDAAMIPAAAHYPFEWDTVVINPYKVSLREMNDTILLKLKDSMDCAFHPPAIGDLTSGFGPRRWGRKAKFHYGVDVRMEVGDPVYAIFDGVVRVAKRSSDYGYVVLIRHYNGLETLYAHFDQLLAYPGKPVRSGEIIGLSGNTGRSTGPHLHFEVRYKGEKIDPNKIIYFPSGSLLSDTLQIDRHCFSHLTLYKAQQAKLRSRYYVVKRGDTLGKIAYKNGVSAKQIARLNRITSKTKLKAGRRLRIR